jgi:hypothetical protein
MTESKNIEIEFEYNDFEFDTLDEELQVDQRCQQLLKHFYLNLLQRGMTAEVASEIAFSTDLYLRDYLLDFGRQNVVRPQPGIIRKFAGSWFITHTLDPEFLMLEQHLKSIMEFYRYLRSQHLISGDELAFLEQEAGETELYKIRINDFIGLTGASFVAWDQECPAKF